MEGKDQSHQEEIPARVPTYSSILPSMPQESDSQDGASQTHAPPPPPQQHHAARHSHPPAFSGFKQHYVQPRATHPSAESGGLLTSSDIPSSRIYGHSPYSSSTSAGSETYSPLLQMSGISPVQPYQGFGSYQSPQVYGYGSSGQGFSYDTNTSIPNATLGVPGSQPGSYGAATMGAEPPFGAQGFPYYGSGGQYPQQQYSGHTIGHGYDGAPRSGRGHYQGGPYQPVTKSYAKNPGKPIFKNDNRLGPEGANLFVFHIPNEMTNYDLLQLFQPYGNVLSVRIMTEEATGRGRGYGFVSFDTSESAANAIHHLNGLPIQGKRLKVQYKQVRHDAQDRQRYPAYEGSILPVQDYASRPAYEPRQREHFIDQPQAVPGFVPIRETDESGAQVSPIGPDSSHEGGDIPPSTGFMPAHDKSTSAQSHPKTRVFDSILPSIDDLNTDDIDYSGNQGEQRNTPSPSPLTDLKDIGRALPDP